MIRTYTLLPFSPYQRMLPWDVEKNKFVEQCLMPCIRTEQCIKGFPDNCDARSTMQKMAGDKIEFTDLKSTFLRVQSKHYLLQIKGLQRLRGVAIELLLSVQLINLANYSFPIKALCCLMICRHDRIHKRFATTTQTRPLLVCPTQSSLLANMGSYRHIF